MGLVTFNLCLQTINHPNKNHSYDYKWDTQPSFLFLTLCRSRNTPINPRNQLGKHYIFFPSWEESGRCCTDTFIVVKVVRFNGEFYTMAPLTWLRLIGDPRKAIEWLYHNNGCYPSATQPNCMFVWNNPLQATKGQPRAALILEHIPGDLNTSPPALRKKHVTDKDACIPPMCSVASSHGAADYSTASVVTSICVMD